MNDQQATCEKLVQVEFRPRGYGMFWTTPEMPRGEALKLITLLHKSGFHADIKGEE